MRFSLASIAAVTSIISTVHARIYGIAVPQTIKPGDSFDAIILSSNYIQTVYDVSIAFGFDQGDGHRESLGSVIGSYYLGPAKSNHMDNMTQRITLPKTAIPGDGILTASLFSLYGAASGPTLSNYNVTVTFGDSTSDKYVASNV